MRLSSAQLTGRAAGCQRVLCRSRQYAPQRAVSHSVTCCAATPAEAATRKALPKLQPLDVNYEARHAFSAYANWLIPDAVMLGRYPFVEPSRCFSREQGESQLEDILLTGINTFVCLQAEVPPQDQMKLGGVNGFLPYKATAELLQSALSGPPPMELVDGSLRNPTLDRFLPPKRHHKQEQAQYAQRVKPKALHFLHSPIVDLGLPSTSSIQTLVPELKSRLEAGEKLYIHCWGGRGRAATVGACLLIAAYGLGAEEALERVQRAYNTRNDPQLATSPETPAQMQFVREFAAAGGV